MFGNIKMFSYICTNNKIKTNMRRSKKELEALNAAYSTCLEVIDVIGDIIVGCEDHEFSQEDIDRVEKATIFKCWYEKVIIK